MRIIVPTRGRTLNQRTIQFMSPELRKQTLVVCPIGEIDAHRANPFMEGVEYHPQPDPDMTIAAKRAYILTEYTAFTDDEKIVMLDDDLRFYVRIDDDDWRLRYAEAPDQEAWFGALAETLSPEMPHAGFGPRQGNNTQAAGWQQPGRMMFALGYHVPTLLTNCELGRIETREDFDYSLQLLRKGFPNAVCHTFAVGQAAYNEAGGASLERTAERSDSDAKRLAELHPGYVTVVPRQYKETSRLEVTCYWKKALTHGQQWRRDQEGGVQAGG